MDKSLQHVGILGMKWGRRKVDTSGSADHRRAITNRNLYSSKKRLELEKIVDKVKERHKDGKRTTLSKDMSDKEIRAFLKRPAMKKTVNDIKRDRVERIRKIQGTVGSIVAAGLVLHATGTDRMVVYMAKRALTTYINNRKYVKVAADVIDSHFVN